MTLYNTRRITLNSSNLKYATIPEAFLNVFAHIYILQIHNANDIGQLLWTMASSRTIYQIFTGLYLISASNCGYRTFTVRNTFAGTDGTAIL